MCFYRCSLADAVKQSQSYPPLVNTLLLLCPENKSIASNGCSINELLCSIEGDFSGKKSEGNKIMVSVGSWSLVVKES